MAKKASVRLKRDLAKRVEKLLNGHDAEQLAEMVCKLRSEIHYLHTSHRWELTKQMVNRYERLEHQLHTATNDRDTYHAGMLLLKASPERVREIIRSAAVMVRGG